MITVGGWILFGCIFAVVSFIAFMFFIECDTAASKALLFICCLGILVGSFFAIRWWHAETEAGKRAVKDQESNFGDGITRCVNVYDMEGDLIKTYEGKFDIEMNDTRILFDDENGKRHIVYFTTGTVVIDET